MKFQYQKLARTLQQQIAQGQYVKGERMPSVRQLAKTCSVSISTVMQCYRTLENEGLICASSRSGYFVTASNKAELKQSEITLDLGEPVKVIGQQMALAMSKAAADPKFMHLGAALPAASFLPKYELQKAMMQVVKTNASSFISYENSRGAPILRLEIAKRMALQGVNINPDDIIITNGCQEALMLSLKVVTQPGDIVAIESPAYYGLLQAIDAAGLKALPLPCDPHTGLIPEALAQALEQWPIKACVLIANFSNPLGSLMPDEKKKQILELLDRKAIPLIEDDTYGDLGFNGSRPSSFLALSNATNVFYCNTFSKTVSPDLRIGWVIAPGHTNKLEYLKFINNISAASIPQLALANLLKSGKYARYLEAVKPQYKKAIERLTELVLDLFPPSTKVSDPQGGFVLWIELPYEVDGDLLTQSALKNNISIAPGSIFSPIPQFCHYIRLNAAVVDNAILKRSIKVLADLCYEQMV